MGKCCRKMRTCWDDDVNDSFKSITEDKVKMSSMKQVVIVCHSHGQLRQNGNHRLSCHVCPSGSVLLGRSACGSYAWCTYVIASLPRSYWSHFISFLQSEACQFFW